MKFVVCMYFYLYMIDEPVMFSPLGDSDFSEPNASAFASNPF